MPIPYRVKAQSLEACSCAHGCNCQFGGFPNEGFCEFVIAYQVQNGRVGNVVLDGVRSLVVMKYPGAIHQGNGHAAFFVDARATAEQADAFTSIVSGKLGGMPWEALGKTWARFEGPVRTPIDITLDDVRSTVKAPGVAEMQFTPLKNPVSKEDKTVYIVYPNGGFFWKEGHVSTTSTMRSEYGDLAMDWPDRYAAAAEVNWTNQT